MINPVPHAKVFLAAPSRFRGVVDVVLKGEIEVVLIIIRMQASGACRFQWITQQYAG
jgi:hypothetical protein